MKIVTLRCGACSPPPGAGTRPGLIVREAKAAVVVGRHASESFEAGLERLVLLVVGMRVSAVRVRLPDLDERVTDGLAVGVDDAPLDDDLLAADARSDEVVGDEPIEPDVQERPDRLRGCRSAGSCAPPRCPQIVVHRRLVAPAQHDVEAEAERLFRNRGFPVERRHQPAARTFVGNARVHRIVVEQRIAGEIHLRDEPRRERRSEQREMDVRRPPCVVAGSSTDRRRA